MGKNVLRSSFIMIFIFFFTGCSVKQMENYKNQAEAKKQEKKKEIIYKRPKITKDLEQKVYEIVDALAKKDINKINTKYINKELGFYNLYKIDGYERFFHQREIMNENEFRFDEIANIINRVSTNVKHLKINKTNTVFKCSPNDDKYYGWTKFGLFLSDKTSPKLEQLMKEFNTKVKHSFYDKNDLQIAKQIQKESYKVVLTPEVIFYLTKLDKSWYITLFDRLSINCSAK